jgi:hypothetical protein
MERGGPGGAGGDDTRGGDGRVLGETFDTGGFEMSGVNSVHTFVDKNDKVTIKGDVNEETKDAWFRLGLGDVTFYVHFEDAKHLRRVTFRLMEELGSVLTKTSAWAGEQEALK